MCAPGLENCLLLFLLEFPFLLQMKYKHYLRIIIKKRDIFFICFVSVIKPESILIANSSFVKFINRRGGMSVCRRKNNYVLKYTVLTVGRTVTD